MKTSILRPALLLALSAVGFSALSSDASAYTRRVCGLAGAFDSPSNISFGNCSANNGDSTNHYAFYSIPIDNTNSITAKTFVTSAMFTPYVTSARLRTFQDSTTWSTGSLVNCSSCDSTPEQYTLDCSGSGCTVPSGGSATVKIDLGAGATVYDVEITQ